MKSLSSHIATAKILTEMKEILSKNVSLKTQIDDHNPNSTT